MQTLIIRLLYSIERHHRRWALVGLLLLLVIILVHSTTLYDKFYYSMVDAAPNRGAAVPKTDICGDVVKEIVYLNQGWEPSDSLWFYNISQGSNLMPYDFFLVLEQEKSDTLFRLPENINRYRYLPQNETGANKDALPVGMVANTYRGKKYMGYTCAACHCSQVNYKGKGIRIDGGPAAADMEGFLQALDGALQATRNDPAKLQRFVGNVLKKGNYSNAKEVEDELKTYWQRLRAYNYFNQSLAKDFEASVADNDFTPVDYGFARLDAFGRIYNRVLGHVLDPVEIQNVLLETLPPEERKQIEETLAPFMNETDRDTLLARVLDALTSKPEYQLALRKTVFHSPNAPVSYPFLWDITLHDYLQWNGVAANAGEGPIGRNAGEVIGVFGTLDWIQKKGWTFYSAIQGQGFGPTYTSFESSVKVHNLRLIEERLGKLQSPTWGDGHDKAGLPPILWKRVARGQQLFEKNCAACHTNVDRTSPSRRIVAHLDGIAKVGTDPKMATNSVEYTGYSGILRNRYSSSSVGGILLDTKAPVVAVLTKATENTVATPDPDKWFFTRGADWAVDLIEELRLNAIKPSVKTGDYAPDTTNAPFASVKSYKGRALNGIWATAPFLHNGSVPSLYDLLLPAREQPSDPPGTKYRPKTFLVGSRELDPVKVGFKSAGYNDGFQFKTEIPGNSNTGHEYGTREVKTPDGTIKAFTKEDRLDVVEYLKSLGTTRPKDWAPEKEPDVPYEVDESDEPVKS